MSKRTDPFLLTTTSGAIDDWRTAAAPDVHDSPAIGLRVQVVRAPRGAAVETTTYLENRRDEASPLPPYSAAIWKKCHPGRAQAGL